MGKRGKRLKRQRQGLPPQVPTTKSVADDSGSDSEDEAASSGASYQQHGGGLLSGGMVTEEGDGDRDLLGGISAGVNKTAGFTVFYLDFC